MINWFSSLPQWFQMAMIGCIIIPLAYRLIRYGFSIKFKAPGGASGELDADNSPSSPAPQPSSVTTDETKNITSGENK